MMPVVPPSPHILVLDMAEKTSVCAGLQPEEWAPSGVDTCSL